VGDPYSWLEDLSSEETLKFIEERNRRFREFVDDLPREFVSRVRKYLGVPYVRSFKCCGCGVYVVVRELSRYVVKLIRWGGGEESIISSENLGEEVVISEVYPSPSGSKLGIAYTLGGSDEGFIKVIDVGTHEVLDELRGTVGNLVWCGEDRYYYVRMFRSGKSVDGVEAPTERVFLRELGGGVEELVFGEGLPTNYMISLEECNDPSRIFITVWRSWCSTYVCGGYLRDPSTWSVLLDVGDYLIKPVGYVGDEAYLVIHDRGGMGRVVKVVGGDVEEVIPEQEYPLRQAVIAGGMVVTNSLINASSRLRIFSTDGSLIKEFVFSKPLSIESMESFKDLVVLKGESFSKPASLYVVDLNALSIEEFYGCGEVTEVRVSEDWVVSSVGTRVHVFIIEGEGSGKADVAIVYGYGGFGIPVTPFYLGPLIPFIEDGGTFVVANIRGGGEFGEEWHRLGMRERKQNVFEDFKAVLKYVRGKGLRTVGWGVSNGGLLIATVMTQSPNLLDTALIGYPVIDMLKFHKLYIGKLWISEYGDPDNPRDREYLIKYSPYHNVREGVKYPPTLVYTGLHDDRVHPAHALKFVAKLESVGAPAYLRVETRSGHRGATPETKVREYSDILTFTYKVLKIKNH